MQVAVVHYRVSLVVWVGLLLHLVWAVLSQCHPVGMLGQYGECAVIKNPTRMKSSQSRVMLKWRVCNEREAPSQEGHVAFFLRPTRAIQRREEKCQRQIRPHDHCVVSQI